MLRAAALRSLGLGVKAWAILGVACAAACGERSAAPGPSTPAAIAAPAPSSPAAPAAPPAPEPEPIPAAPCDDALAGALARVSCDGTRFVVAHPIELHPDRPAPAEPTRGVLHAVSEILDKSPDILFVRIEVSVGTDVGKDPEKRRAALAAAQRRADALLAYLWRKRGISAERLEAVAYEHDARRARSDAPWPVVLRIVQRAKR